MQLCRPAGPAAVGWWGHPVSACVLQVCLANWGLRRSAGTLLCLLAPLAISERAPPRPQRRGRPVATWTGPRRGKSVSVLMAKGLGGRALPRIVSLLETFAAVARARPGPHGAGGDAGGSALCRGRGRGGGVSLLRPPLGCRGGPRVGLGLGLWVRARYFPADVSPCCPIPRDFQSSSFRVRSFHC